MKYRFSEGERLDEYDIHTDYVLVGGEFKLISYPRWKNDNGGALIRQKRKELGITLRRAAGMLGISGTELTRIETGRYVLLDDNDFNEIISKLDMK
jgi:hypothetical protein